MPTFLLPAVFGVAAAAWNGVVNAFNGASGRTTQRELEGQRLVHQKQLQENQIVAQLEIEYMRTMSQIKLQQNNQQFQLDLQQNNQQFQLDLQQNNQQFQFDLETYRQQFQTKIVEYQCQENRKLQEFIKAVDMQIAKSNQEFQTWLFQQQKQLQIELAQYNRETQFLNAIYQRETALQLKELDNWPLKIYPSQILQYHQSRDPIPVQIILAPPEIDYDRFEHLNNTSTSAFPKVEKRLSQHLRNFLEKYYPLENQQRPTELIDRAWDSNRFAGGSSVKALFGALKSEQILLIESEVDGDFINIRVGYWSGGQEISPFYKPIISHLHYPQILYQFAIKRALNWETNTKNILLAKGKTEAEINQEYGGDNALNLQIYKKSQQDKADGIEIERHYKTNSDDFGKLSTLLGAYHNIIASLFTDIHYLIYNNLPPKLPELLADLETDFSVDKRLANDMFKMVVESYIGALTAMQSDRSELVPGFAAHIALGLTKLNDNFWAETMLDFAVSSWLESRQIPVKNEAAKFDVMDFNLLPLDMEFVTQVNLCLTGLHKPKKLSVINSCYRRAIEKSSAGKYQEAIIDFGYVVDLNPGFADGYYRRSLANIKLEKYREAITDLTKVLELDSSLAQAYNHRGYCYYKLGQYQQAVDDYEQAVKLGLTEAVKNRDIALGVWEEIQREAEEKRQREAEEEIQRKAEEKRQREAEEKIQREAEEKIQRESVGEIFTFEVVTVNKSGNIINRTPTSARQKIQDLGNGMKLEMVYIPGGSFLMGSPENEAHRQNNESRQHQVTLQPFYMSKYPITQDQYQAIMGENPSGFKGGNRPVENVTWHKAKEFYQKLSQKTRKTYRLPSEAEWEYACRAGTTTPTPFYFGETITSDLANYNGENIYASEPKGIYRQQTTEVGSFPPNAFGLYDMHGNVWEWCQDVWHENYGNAPADGSAWEVGGESKYRVLRGGCWNYYPRYCRSANRNWISAGNCNYNRGFRVVCLPGI